MADADVTSIAMTILRNMRDREEASLRTAADWPDYKRRMGRLTAIEDAENDIREALKSYFNQDESEE